MFFSFVPRNVKKYLLTAYTIKTIRKQTGMNREDFADWLHIPYRMISDREHEERQMQEYAHGIDL